MLHLWEFEIHKTETQIFTLPPDLPRAQYYFFQVLLKTNLSLSPTQNPQKLDVKNGLQIIQYRNVFTASKGGPQSLLGKEIKGK